MNVLIFATIPNHTLYYATLAGYFHRHGTGVTVLGSVAMQENLRALNGDAAHTYLDMPDGLDVPALMDRYRETLDRFQAILFDEGYGRPAAYYAVLRSLPKKVWKIQTVHNINTQLRPRFYLNWDNFRDNLNRKRCMQAMDALLVCSPVLKEYIRDQTDYRRPVFSLPFLRPQETQTAATRNGRVVFGIPGGIHSRRRHYGMVLDAFRALWEEEVPVSLKLVGTATPAAEDQGVVHRCRELRARFGAECITFFEERLSDEEFDRQMNGTDVILCNLEPVYDMTGTREVYGQTKESGITFHILNYAKPALVPRELVLMPRLDQQVRTYENADDLKKSVQAFAADPAGLSACAHNAQETAAYYRGYFDGEFTLLYQYVVKQMKR